MKIKRITFVWNADFNLAGGVRALKEVVEGHHTCTLCAIAYHRITQTKEFQTYKKSLAKQFHAKIKQPCKNQLSKAEKLAAQDDYPTVLAHTDHGIIKLLGSHEIDSCAGNFQTFKEKLDSAFENKLAPSS